MIMIDKSKITKEMLEKATQCETAEELIALAKKAGCEITKAEAEAFLAELGNLELDKATLEKIAGGTQTCYMVDGCAFKCAILK